MAGDKNPWSSGTTESKQRLNFVNWAIGDALREYVRKIYHRHKRFLPMPKLIVIASFVLLLFAACGPQLETREEVDLYGDRLVYTVNPETGEREGSFRRYDIGGSLVETAEYRKGELAGQRVLLSVVGDTLVVEEYALKGEGDSLFSIFSGPYLSYYPEDNTVRQSGQYADNQMSGVWKQYYPNGQVKEAVTFSGNEENGPFREWNEAGVLTAEGSYKDGEFEHGQLRLYDDDGTLVRVMHCDLGVCSTRWRPDEGGEPPARRIPDL